MVIDDNSAASFDESGLSVVTRCLYHASAFNRSGEMPSTEPHPDRAQKEGERLPEETLAWRHRAADP